MTAKPLYAQRAVARGVTLLELIVAVSILGVVAALLWGTFSRTWSSRLYAESRAETYAVARAAVAWLERDLTAGGASVIYPDGKVLFVSRGLGERESTDHEKPLLHITTASALGTAALEFSPHNEVPMPGPQRGEQARVLYRLELDDDLESKRNAPMILVRYEWRPPAITEREHASRAVIVRDVVSVRFRFSNDGSEWKETWDTTTTRVAHFPRTVETKLVLADDDGVGVEFVSATAIPIGGPQGG
jgi:prepilin-type N-terminal cleavage/methylation domain-containing protein